MTEEKSFSLQKVAKRELEKVGGQRNTEQYLLMSLEMSFLLR